MNQSYNHVTQVLLPSKRKLFHAIFVNRFTKKTLLKGLFTNFDYITLLSWLNGRNIFYERSISIKQLWNEIIEKIGSSKSVRLSTVIYTIYITRPEIEHHFSQLFRVSVVLSRWTFHKKCFSFDKTRKNVVYSKLVNNSFKHLKARNAAKMQVVVNLRNYT